MELELMHIVQIGLLEKLPNYYAQHKVVWKVPKFYGTNCLGHINYLNIN
jgi:hypothetical protein